MTLIKKILLYFSSLWLFFIFLCIREIDFNSFNVDNWSAKQLVCDNLIAVVSLLLAFAGMSIVCWLKNNWNVSGDHCKKLVEVESKNGDYLVFITTCILPLLPFDTSDINQLLLIFAIIISFGFILIRTDMYYTNPTLAIFGYKLYEVSFELFERSNSRSSNHGINNNKVVVERVNVLCLDRLKKGDIIRLQAYDDGLDEIYFAKLWKSV